MKANLNKWADTSQSWNIELSAAGDWLVKSREVGGHLEILEYKVICHVAWLSNSMQVWASGRTPGILEYMVICRWVLAAQA